MDMGTWDETPAAWLAWGSQGASELSREPALQGSEHAKHFALLLQRAGCIPGLPSKVSHLLLDCILWGVISSSWREQSWKIKERGWGRLSRDLSCSFLNTLLGQTLLFVSELCRGMAPTWKSIPGAFWRPIKQYGRPGNRDIVVVFSFWDQIMNNVTAVPVLLLFPLMAYWFNNVNGLLPKIRFTGIRISFYSGCISYILATIKEYIVVALNCILKRGVQTLPLQINWILWE